MQQTTISIPKLLEFSALFTLGCIKGTAHNTVLADYGKFCMFLYRASMTIWLICLPITLMRCLNNRQDYLKIIYTNFYMLISSLLSVKC